MQTLKITPENILKAIDFIKQGGVVIHPTDTCYGLAADITNEKAVNKIYALKQMKKEKPMSILVNDLEMFKKYAELSPEAEDLAQKHLPGALTLVVSKTKNVPKFYAENTNMIGVRIPDHKLSLELVASLKKPITTTSANITGYPQAYSPEEVEKYFKNEEVLLLDGRVLPNKKPSTILKIVDGKIDLIRQGDLLVI